MLKKRQIVEKRFRISKAGAGGRAQPCRKNAQLSAARKQDTRLPKSKQKTAVWPRFRLNRGPCDSQRRSGSGAGRGGTCRVTLIACQPT